MHMLTEGVSAAGVWPGMAGGSASVAGLTARSCHFMA
jgi:hypothetical protein